MPLLAKTGRVYFVGKYLNQKVAVKLKIKRPAQDIFDLRYRISNKLQVLRQQQALLEMHYEKKNNLLKFVSMKVDISFRNPILKIC